MFDIDPVKPKALALVQQAEASLLNKGSCFARALGVTKFIIVIWSHFVVLLKSDLNVQKKTPLRLGHA
jgi:hypothetical protein